jgi:ABC-type molybdate transport system substrate-binding protein
VLARRIAAGEPVDLLLTTDTGLIGEVAAQGTAATAFAQDLLVFASRPELSVNAANLLDRMMNPRLRIGLALPAGGNSAAPAQQFFALAEAHQPGSGDSLRARTRPVQATGDLPAPRRIMELLGSGEVDVVMGAASALRTLTAVADLVEPPAALLVTITSFLAVLATEPGLRHRSLAYGSVLSGPTGQALLSRHGFSPAAARV